MSVREFPTFFSLVRQDYLAQLQAKRSIGEHFATLIFGRGFHTLLSYRLQRLLLKIPYVGKIFAKVIRYISCTLTACDISYYAELDGGIYMPHPTGIVIGDQVKVGANTTILQQVTLGTKTKRGSDYPTIGSNVYLGAGAKIIGSVIIGNNALIGANAVVLSNVPENSTAVGIPAHIIDPQSVSGPLTKRKLAG